MSYKITNKVFLYTSFIFFVLFLFLMYCYDPMHIYRNKNNYYNGNMYVNAKYIIDNINYDSVICGTSILENTSCNEASEKLGGNFTNISLSSSSFKSRNIVLRYLFKKRKIKRIIYSVDMSYFGYFLNEKTGNYLINDWAFLYDNNPFNNIKLYFNEKHIKCLFKWSKNKNCIGYKINYDRPNAWFKEEDYKNSWIYGIKAWKKKYIEEFISEYKNKNDKNLPDIDLIKQKGFEYIFSLINEYKDIDFILIIPPYSTLYYSIMLKNRPNNFNYIQEIIKFIANECSKNKNCSLFAFNNEDFTNDLKNYKDMRHYSEKINSYMLDKVSKNENIINNKNVNDYINKFLNRVKKYDIEDIIRELKNNNLWKL